MISEVYLYRSWVRDEQLPICGGHNINVKAANTQLKQLSAEASHAFNPSHQVAQCKRMRSTNQAHVLQLFWCMSQEAYRKAAKTPQVVLAPFIWCEHMRSFGICLHCSTSSGPERPSLLCPAGPNE